MVGKAVHPMIPIVVVILARHTFQTKLRPKSFDKIDVEADWVDVTEGADNELACDEHILRVPRSGWKADELSRLEAQQ
mgnify:CR=1 FL=1|jgi:hypothetical protein